MEDRNRMRGIGIRTQNRERDKDRCGLFAQVRSQYLVESSTGRVMEVKVRVRVQVRVKVRV